MCMRASTSRSMSEYANSDFTYWKGSTSLCSRSQSDEIAKLLNEDPRHVERLVEKSVINNHDLHLWNERKHLLSRNPRVHSFPYSKVGPE